MISINFPERNGCFWWQYPGPLNSELNNNRTA
jgi:hypothetical protein